MKSQAWLIADALVASTVAAIAPDDIEVLPGNPADARPLPEAVWIETTKSKFEWRGLGGARTEMVSVQMVVAAFRESGDQRRSQLEARERVDELVAAIEAVAVGANQTLSGTCTDALVEDVERRNLPSEKGWEVQAIVTVTCKHLP